MLYYILYPLMKLISFIPLGALYAFSDGASWFIRRVLKYRIDVVTEQLTYAFPEKSEAEIQVIIKKYYKGFTDQWIETVKSLSWNVKQLNQHIEGDLSLIDGEQPTFLIYLGHQFNWELANLYSAASSSPKPFGVMYMPIKSKAFDRLFLKIRSRTGTTLIPADHFKKHIQALNKGPFTLSFIADQNPGAIERAAWRTFFHREIPFLKTPFRMAHLFNARIVFASIKKKKRGRYHIDSKLICEKARDFEVDELVDQYVQHLEDSIREQPENWLWTHKRWKHAGKNIQK